VPVISESQVTLLLRRKGGNSISQLLFFQAREDA
jgi:hypothetical protein